ncbi:DUF2187 family protein, partial [Staphylococcus aureus]
MENFNDLEIKEKKVIKHKRYKIV